MKIYEGKFLQLETTDPESIAKVLPKIKILSKENNTYSILTKWTHKNAMALAQLGYSNVPPPMLTHYKWKGRYPPFEHQKITAGFLSLYKRAYCFSDAGTGKTAAVLWAIDYLMDLGLVKRALIVCPLSIMRAAWEQDVCKFVLHRTAVVAHGTKKTREKIMQQNTPIVITNFEGVESNLQSINTGGFDLIVVDEATAYKNYNTNRWKVLNRVAKNMPFLWLLTGTPAAQAPTDAYGLARLVSPHRVPPSFTVFRANTMYNPYGFKWLPKANAKDIVYEALQPAIRFKKQDCLDLPEVMHLDREVPLTSEQIKYLKEFKTHNLINKDNKKIIAANGAVVLSKMLQISGGVAYDALGEPVYFDVSSRIKEVLDIVEASDNKVIIAVPYTHTIKLIKETLEAHGIKTEVINGKVSADERGRIVKAFQEQQEPRVLVLQPKAAAHGLTLTAADTIIWYSPVSSVETYLQLNARINRPGQKNNMTIYHIWGSKLEKDVYEAMSDNVNAHQKITALYEVLTEY